MNREDEEDIYGITRRYNAKDVERKSKSNSKKYKKMNKKSKNLSGNKKGYKKNKKPPKTWVLVLKRIIIVLFILGILAFLTIAGVIAGTFISIFGDDFKLSKEDLVIAMENSTIYDSEGNVLAILNGDEQRKIISLSDMPEILPKAYEAIEDERFREHTGVDFKRTAGATLKFITSGGKSDFGGSTITQQLVKNITDEDDRTWTRKVKEMAKAIQIEKLISKDQIMELYLNIIFVGGNGIHGVALGSEYYFNKECKDLDLAECAFLAGINHSPNRYNIFLAKDEKKESVMKDIKNRTETVLMKMKQLGYITEDQYKTAYDEVEAGLNFHQGETINKYNYSYHTEAAINQIIDQLVKEKGMTKDMAKTYLYSRGLKIYTTQVTEIQNIMQAEFEDPVYIRESRENYDENGDPVTSQAAMVILDHTNGYVVGCVGGLGQKKETMGWNRATQSTKQTGSTMKPIGAVAPAIEEGVITAGTVYADVPTSFGNWRPKNYDGSYRGLMTVRDTIEISHNIGPAAIVYNDLGVEKSKEFLAKVGITSIAPEDEAAALALGGLTNGITPLEMAGAYGAIANDGLYIQPTFYTKVEDSKGNIVLEPNQRKEQVMNPSNAYIVKDILTEPVYGGSGTAKYCSISGIETAAKTGTTSDDYDRWLCGFTPYYTATTWYGYDKNETVSQWGGSNPAGKLWAAIMQPVHEGLPNAQFEVPDDIVKVTICSKSGMLPTELCSEDGVYTEVFVNGTQPTERCNCHVACEVCADSEMLPIEKNCPNIITKVCIAVPESGQNSSWPSSVSTVPNEYCDIHTAPIATPTPTPTAAPTEKPTAEPTAAPTAEPTKEPTAEPTKEPTAEPTAEPTTSAT